MGRADYYNSGNWNAICDECGKKYKFSELKLRWDGLYVCEREWEIRQPQDYLKGIADHMSVPVSRPEAPNLYNNNIALNKWLDGCLANNYVLG